MKKEKLRRFFLGYNNPTNIYEECPAFFWFVVISQLFVIGLLMWGILNGK